MTNEKFMATISEFAEENSLNGYVVEEALNWADGLSGDMKCKTIRGFLNNICECGSGGGMIVDLDTYKSTNQFLQGYWEEVTLAITNAMEEMELESIDELICAWDDTDKFCITDSNRHLLACEAIDQTAKSLLNRLNEAEAA